MYFIGETHHDISDGTHSGEFNRFVYLLRQHCLFEDYQFRDQSVGVASTKWVELTIASSIVPSAISPPF